jgi:putative membrane protein
VDGVVPGGRRPTWIWAILGGAILVVAAVLLLLLLDSEGVFGGARHPGPFFGYWGGFLLLFLVLWVSFFIVRVAFWTRRRSRWAARPDYSVGRDSAIAIARRRYARGEITREQFDQIMTDLTRRRTPP